MTSSVPYEALQDAINRYNEGKPECERLPMIPFHALRHTFASLALQNSVDIRTVSGMLGHADPGFTLRIYTHTMSRLQVQAAATIGQVIGGNL